jgi:hypothetical protein
MKEHYVTVRNSHGARALMLDGRRKNQHAKKVQALLIIIKKLLFFN